MGAELFVGAVRAAQAVEATDDQGFSCAKRLEEAIELRASAFESGGVLGADALALSLLEHEDLLSRVSVNLGHQCVPDAHVAFTLENSSAVDCVTATLLSRGKESLSPRFGGRSAR